MLKEYTHGTAFFKRSFEKIAKINAIRFSGIFVPKIVKKHGFDPKKEKKTAFFDDFA